MRRLWRLVLNVLTVLSLLICAATLPLLYIAFSQDEEIFTLGGTRPWGQVSIWSGHVLLEDAQNPFSSGYSIRISSLLLWSIALPLARVLAARSNQFAKRHRVTRDTSGHCRACGYDLRATPDRCPECGTVSADAAASNIPKGRDSFA